MELDAVVDDALDLREELDENQGAQQRRHRAGHCYFYGRD
jgi:hypothetical protein